MSNLKKLQQTLTSQQGFAIFSPVNRRYFSNVQTSFGLLLVAQDTATLYVDFRYFDLARQTAASDIQVRLLPAGSIYETLAKECKSLSISTIYLEDEYLTVAQQRDVQAALASVNINIQFDSNRITRLRQIKSAAEIKCIEKAQQITEQALDALLPEIHIGMSEKQVMARLIFHLYNFGAEGLAFDPIVVSGQGSALPHGVATDRLLQSGTFLTMDFGAVYQGYCADMTRTVALGYADEKMQQIYQTVLSAQNAALSAIRGQVEGSLVDTAARNIIKSAGYGDCFGHSTGHSLGLEVHEAPSFSPTYTAPIPTGAVMSVEPGIYISGRYGVRIEDIVVVTESGIKNLTKCKKDLIIIN